MAYVIAEPCIGTKDTACVDACPVDCIHPKKDDPRFEAETMLYIDPVEMHRLRRLRAGLPSLSDLHHRRSAGQVVKLRADEREVLWIVVFPLWLFPPAAVQTVGWRVVVKRCNGRTPIEDSGDYDGGSGNLGEPYHDPVLGPALPPRIRTWRLLRSVRRRLVEDGRDLLKVHGHRVDLYRAGWFDGFDLLAGSLEAKEGGLDSL
jgi:NAD-dependent dihydropyrimidine dehydrogenase PreA subunit